YLLLPALAYVAAAIALSAMLPSVPRAAWIVAMLAFATFVNSRGIETTTRINFVLLGVQGIVLVILLAMCAVGVARNVGSARLSVPHSYSQAGVARWSFFGACRPGGRSFRGSAAFSTLSEEVKGGPGMVARAPVLSLILCAPLFFLHTSASSLFALGRTSFPP